MPNQKVVLHGMCVCVCLGVWSNLKGIKLAGEIGKCIFHLLTSATYAIAAHIADTNRNGRGFFGASVFIFGQFLSAAATSRSRLPLYVYFGRPHLRRPGDFPVEALLCGLGRYGQSTPHTIRLRNLLINTCRLFDIDVLVFHF